MGVGCFGFIAIIAAVLFPVFAKTRDLAREAVSDSNLKQLGIACVNYAQQNNQKLPPLDSVDDLKAALSPYLTGANKDELFVEPGTGQTYALNAQESNVDVSQLPHPESVVLMRDPIAHSDGDVYVLYADGHTDRLPMSSINAPPAGSSQ